MTTMQNIYVLNTGYLYRMQKNVKIQNLVLTFESWHNSKNLKDNEQVDTEFQERRIVV